MTCVVRLASGPLVAHLLLLLVWVTSIWALGSVAATSSIKLYHYQPLQDGVETGAKESGSLRMSPPYSPFLSSATPPFLPLWGLGRAETSPFRTIPTLIIKVTSSSSSSSSSGSSPESPSFPVLYANYGESSHGGISFEDLGLPWVYIQHGQIVKRLGQDTTNILDDTKSAMASIDVLNKLIADSSKVQESPSLIFLSLNLGGLTDEGTKAGLMAGLRASMISFQTKSKGAAFLIVSDALSTSPAETLRVQLSKRATSDAVCPKTLDACKSTFSNCSRHGACTLVPLSSSGKDCYFCKCTKVWTDDAGVPDPKRAPVIWTGDSCQYQDVSVSFAILLTLAIVLSVSMIAVVGLMSSVAQEGVLLQGSWSREKME